MDYNTLVKLAINALDDGWYPSTMFPPSEYYKFLRRLAAHVKPNLSVELGTCGGGGSLHLALGWPQGNVLGVDIQNPYPDHILHVVRKCPNFRFIRMDSVDAIRIVSHPMNGYGGVDILFIDTIHTYDRVMLEFNAWRPYLSRSAIVIIDDLLKECMGTVFEDLPGKKCRLDFLHGDVGFGVIYDIH